MPTSSLSPKDYSNKISEPTQRERARHFSKLWSFYAGREQGISGELGIFPSPIVCILCGRASNFSVSKSLIDIQGKPRKFSKSYVLSFGFILLIGLNDFHFQDKTKTGLLDTSPYFICFMSSNVIFIIIYLMKITFFFGHRF